MNYREESTFWLTTNALEVAQEIGKENADAIVAINELLERVDGARVFKDMKTEFSPDEWEKLYALCEEDTNKVISSLLVINSMNSDELAHKNLALTIPAQFIVGIIPESALTGRIAINGTEQWRLEKQLREEFIKRYKEACTCQPAN